MSRLSCSFHPLVIAALACALLLASASVPARDVAGVAFEEQTRLGDAPLVLNGTGLRTKFFLHVYAIGLYLPHASGDADAAIGQPGAKRVRIVTLRDVGADMFVSGLEKGLEKNLSTAELAALASRTAQLLGLIGALGDLSEKSVLTLDLTAAGNTRLTLNGKPLGQEIAGADFYQALLKIWLGPRPAQDDIKAGLLGRR